MPNYEELYYESQAKLADIEEELKALTLKVRRFMCESEEKVLSDETDGEN